MTEQWELITRLFAVARTLDGEQREAFLSAACNGDTVLRSEVESLLRNDQADSFLASPASAPLARALRESLTLPEAGQILRNRYRLEERMATGGQALVYRATDQLLSRPVVVKFLRMEGREEHALEARLRQEKEVLARIDHPAVVGIFDTGDLADGSPFLVIQYIEGQSLREALRGGPLERQRAAAIVREIGSALSAAHALGIAHRDLKPENVMLQQLGDGTESVKLIDFGIAKVERSQLDPSTTTLMIAGTIRYMAPEQFQGENEPASDIYSLALMVCEMLSGHPDVRALPRGTPRRVQRLLEAALSFRPGDRPQKVRAWCGELAEALTSQSRRHFVRLAGGSAALLGAGAFAGSRWYAALQDTPRLIEYVASFDPLSEGFQIHNDVIGTIVDDPSRPGDYDGWRVTTTRQGDYYHQLTDRQKRLALERGWKLSAVMRAEEGSVHINVDFLGQGKRYDIAVFVNPDTDVVRLNTQIVPAQQGLEFPIARKQPTFRRYELVYDPGLGSATLSVDGKRVLTGYRGHTQFQEDLGVFFGVALYGGARARGTFQSVRFEINP
jgi:tRNA A-37 threonylcarbamoyl transferase component Bud32